MNTNTVETKRIAIFLAVAFGFAWLMALIIYLTGGLVNSPELIPGTGISLALALEAVGYMGAPALGNVVTRLVTREGWQNAMLQPNLQKGWRYWVAGWLLPALFPIVGAALFFILFPQYYDANLTLFRSQLASAPEAVRAMNPWLLIAIQLLQALLFAPLFNSLSTFGEEFGWRAYLLPKLLPLGKRKALLLSGVIWGIWHAPVIAMGHNYGLDYAGFPWLGILVMTWFTVVIGVFIGWVTLRGGSVWPAVLAHAVTNGFAAVSVLVLKGEPNRLLGPTPVGIIASLPIAYLAFRILSSRWAKTETESND